jgi:hypothetical protein
MGDVDEPHDPERQGQSNGKQGIDAAEQDSLDDGINPFHSGGPSYNPK